MDAVLLERTCTDPLYRKAIRTSMGAALSIPFARTDPWPEALRVLARDGWAVMAMTPASAPSLREIASEVSPRRVLVVVGHEGDGLSDAVLDACTHRARIPMMTTVDSLNVATAAAIALYQLTL